MNAVDKPTIYLPVEIKAREFRSKVLLAMLAAQKGFRVYLGTKVSIDKLIKEKYRYGGIYFYKGGKSKDFLVWLKQRAEYFVVLDEEMGPAVQDLEYVYRRRIYPGTEEYVDRLFVIGERHRKVISEVRPQLLSKVEVTGWPRVDLWRASFKSSYSSDIKNLKERFGDFLLFSSDFGILSEESIDQEMERLRRVKSSEEEYAHYERSMRLAYGDFLEFVELVKRINSDCEFPALVIRPHPSEDIRHWHNHLGNLKRVKIIFEGEVSPWLYASSGLLHRGCTTAVQAYVAELPVLYWVGGRAQVKKDTLSYQVSLPVVDYLELRQVCQVIMTGQYQMPLAVAVTDKVHIDENQLACDKIVASLSSLSVSNEPAFQLPAWRKLLRIVRGRFNETRINYGLGRDREKLARIRRKMPGGIHQVEVVKVANDLLPGFSGSIIECDYNVVEIDA